MSIGGVYQLITNDGTQDRLIFATNKLLEIIRSYKINKVASIKRQNPNCTNEQLKEIIKQQSIAPPLSKIDETHILFINNKYKPIVQIAKEYSKTLPTKGSSVLGSKFTFVIPQVGDFVNDTSVYVKIGGLAAVNKIDKVRYVEFLGHKLMKHVQLSIGGNIIDEYGSEDYNNHWQYKVPSNKENGYLRNVGQEQPKQGYLVSDRNTDEVREYRMIGNGAQTFKIKHDSIEMWIPMLFWFNDIKNALPNFMMPTQQVDINITFADALELVSVADNGGGGKIRLPKIEECYLYVNHLFVLPEVLSIFAKKYSFSLIRVHKKHVQELISEAARVRLHQLKWPIECLYISFKPKSNLKHSQKWHRNTYITESSVNTVVLNNNNNLRGGVIEYLDEIDNVSSLALTANDIIIYPESRPSFYNSYLPYRYGDGMKTPRDLGNYIMNFNIYPGEHQPSGHMNVSRARELYLEYTANTNVQGDATISQMHPNILNVSADCINFLLIEKGAAVLRYIT